MHMVQRVIRFALNLHGGDHMTPRRQKKPAQKLIGNIGVDGDCGGLDESREVRGPISLADVQSNSAASSRPFGAKLGLRRMG